MMPLRRREAPGFWRDRERSYLLREDVSCKYVLHQWRHKKRSLAEWFHAEVRAAAEPHLCAYCDARLAISSPETIDHFVPEHAVRELGLSWQNLYPACALCNSTFKGKKWSCRLLRPDVDLIPAAGESELDAFFRHFYFDPATGTLSPAPGADPITRARVRLTLGVFRLNTTARCNARRDRWRDLLNAAKHPCDDGRMEQLASQGPFRFVARLFLTTRGAKPSSPR